MPNLHWMIYGATGYSGALIAEEAVRRGHQPILAGRNPAKLRALTDKLKLETITISLDDPAELAKAIAGVSLVLNCAGPFVFTSLPMMRACLNAGAHYLDITGEVPVFENIYAYDSSARAKGIALIPGVGFDVVASECLAAHVASKVNQPFELEIAIDALGNSRSAGTTLSAVEMAVRGGLERRNGRLVALPLGQGVTSVRFPHGEFKVMPIPWGDLAAAYRSTRSPNILTYLRLGTGMIWLARIFGFPMQIALMIKPVRRLFGGLAAAAARPPDAALRQFKRSCIWARASDLRGGMVEAWLDIPEAYQFTMLAAVQAVEKTLAGKLTGALTPSQAFGADFALEIESVRRLDELG